MLSNLIPKTNKARISGNYFLCDYHDAPFIVDIENRHFIDVAGMDYPGRGFTPSDGTPIGGSGNLYNAGVVLVIPPYPSGFSIEVLSRYVYQETSTTVIGLIFVKKQLNASPYTTSFEVWYGRGTLSGGSYTVMPSPSNVMYMNGLNLLTTPTIRAVTTTRNVVPGNLHFAITQRISGVDNLFVFNFQKPPGSGGVSPTSYQQKTLSGMDVTSIFAMDVQYSTFTLVGNKFCDFASGTILGDETAPKVPSRVFRNSPVMVTV